MKLFTQTTLILSLTAALTQLADAVVLVNFVDDGTNVTMSFNGSFDITSNSPFPPGAGFITYDGGEISSDSIYALETNVYSEILGTQGIALTSSVSNALVGDSLGIFGFNETSLFYDPAATTSVTLTDTDNYTVFLNTSIADLNLAPIASGATLFTANNGDTIQFGSISTIPEPSSTALLGLGVMGFILRRRR